MRMPPKTQPSRTTAAPTARGGERKAPMRRAAASPSDATLNQTVYDSLVDSILTGKLQPGARLAEEQLCNTFGVSRTVVRQALHRLSELQIVNIIPNKGATVASPSPQEAMDVFEARKAVEEAIVRRLAASITPSGLERLRLRLDAEHTALHQHDHPRWVMLAGGFHMALAQMAGNSVLLRMLTELLTRCSLIVAMYEPPGNSQCEHEEHGQLVDYLAVRDADAATALMHQHLSALQSRLQFPLLP